MKRRKKTVAMLLVAAQLLLICGCGAATPAETSEPTETAPATTAAVETTAPETIPAETTAPTETIPETVPVETEEPTETQPAETVPVETQPIETSPAETEPTETEPTVTYTEVSETVYATGTVNVRNGPDTACAKLGQLTKGDSVKRTAIGDNGWSRIEYNGQEAYIYSSYLSTTKPAANDTTTTVTPTSDGSYNGLELAKLAIEYLELPYVSGGNSLTSGTDCSGFTKLIFAQFGITLPRTAAEQSKVGTKVTMDQAKVGDLYAIAYESGAPYTGHAGIYIGNGQIISAMPGEGVVVDMIWGEETVYMIKIGNNTYQGDDLTARAELFRHYIDCGLPYKFTLDSEVTYYPATNSCTFYVTATKGDFFGADIDAINDASKYPTLISEWKVWYSSQENASFRVVVGDRNVLHGYDYYGYLGGEWYTDSELWDMADLGIITETQCCYCQYFCGLPWDSSSAIKTELGEDVSFSNFPN